MSDHRIIIVGAGLCGSMLAISLAQKGHKVSLYERRPDIRKKNQDAGRSINLALSSRGITALEAIGLKEEVYDMCIAMTGRMVHPLDKPGFLSPYSGRQGEYINSISRPGLNMLLLDKAESFDNVEINFDMACTDVDLENAEAVFINESNCKEHKVKGSIVIGSDGSASALRRSMMAKTNALMFNYSQQFLSHGYKELSISPDENGGFRLEKNALHIWPRGSFMIIALPNLDGSFTVTMFHPYKGSQGFNALNSPDKVREFFEQHYTDLIQYMPNYTEEFFNNPTGSLCTIKCYPWQAFGKTLLMGDAAHAVVPFYGQGMNASFEDVRVFSEVMDESGGNWAKTLEVFQERRAKNTNAIADLAIDNFYEMRDKVSDQLFIQKRKVEMELEQTYTDYFSKYSLVTFRPDLPYSEAMMQGRAQDEMLLQIVRDTPGMDLGQIYQRLKAIQTN